MMMVMIWLMMDNNNYKLVVVRDIPSGYLLQFAMEAMALIEIDGLPFLKMVIFHGELLVISRW